MKLKIGHLDFTLKATNATDAEERRRGCYDPTVGNLEIRILPALCPAEQGETLLHELMHAALDMAGARDRKLCEEDICEILDGTLCTIFRDNPEVLVKISLALSNGVPIVTEPTALSGS